MGGGTPTTDLIIYGAGFVVAIVLLAIISKVMKLAAGRRVKNMTFVGMTLDDLERMKQTGLIDEDEIKKVKKSVSEQVIGSALPTTTAPPADLALQEALHEFEQEQVPVPNSPQTIPQPPPNPAPATPELPPQPAPRPKPSLSDILREGEPINTNLSHSIPEMEQAPPEAPPPPEPAKSGASSGMPLDIETLRATGAIDEEEYQRLRAYFKRRSSS